MILFLLFFTVLIPTFVAAIRLFFIVIPERRLPSAWRTKKDLSFKPTVAVIVPCYNEGRHVYDTIKSICISNYPNSQLKVYPQDDGSTDNDVSWNWILKAAQDFPNVFPERNPQNMGKTKTYLRAFERSESEIVVIVDSDTTLAWDSLSILISNFADERIGIVGTPAGVSNPNENALTGFQSVFYFSGFRIVKIPESHFRAVAVVGGHAFCIRRKLMDEIRPLLENRNWFGLEVKDGEDRFITQHALLKGWGTYIDMTARSWTVALNTHHKFFGQQLRWRRNPIRLFGWVLRTLPQQVKMLNPMALFAVTFPAISALCLMMRLFVLLFTHPIVWVSPALFVAYSFVTFLVFALMRFHAPDQFVKNPFKVLLYSGWWVVNSFFLIVLGLFTLDQDDWGHRYAGVTPTTNTEKKDEKNAKAASAT